MIINATQIREGMVLNHEGGLYRVTYTMHVTPGKGVACMQTKLKHMITGKNLEARFRSDARVEKAELETREMQFLYSEPDGFVFMDNKTFDQATLPENMIGDSGKFMVEGKTYLVTYYDDQPIGIEMPKSVELKVTFAPPEMKKATATASLRPVTLENDITVMAPAFIKEGDIIKVNPETGEYLERV